MSENQHPSKIFRHFDIIYVMLPHMFLPHPQHRIRLLQIKHIPVIILPTNTSPYIQDNSDLALLEEIYQTQELFLHLQTEQQTPI